jgi:catechol 2,3-dioxygenase-like lactoylglutathione lyase family enzyme
MTSKITANLPARDFDKTQEFYHNLGFETSYRGDGWMISTFGDTQVEFFHHPNLTPAESWFSACLRTDDMDGLHDAFARANLPQDDKSIPRLTQPFKHQGAPRMFALVDLDGTLWRVIDETDAA